MSKATDEQRSVLVFNHPLLRLLSRHTKCVINSQYSNIIGETQKSTQHKSQSRKVYGMKSKHTSQNTQKKIKLKTQKLKHKRKNTNNLKGRKSKPQKLKYKVETPKSKHKSQNTKVKPQKLKFKS